MTMNKMEKPIFQPQGLHHFELTMMQILLVHFKFYVIHKNSINY